MNMPPNSSFVLRGPSLFCQETGFLATKYSMVNIAHEVTSGYKRLQSSCFLPSSLYDGINKNGLQVHRQNLAQGNGWIAIELLCSPTNFSSTDWLPCLISNWFVALYKHPPVDILLETCSQLPLFSDTGLI